jgi:hypothetical protein
MGRAVGSMLLLATLLQLSSLSGAAPVGPNVPNGIDSGLSARVFKDFGSYVAMIEGDTANQVDNRVYQSVQLGGYYDISENWSVGGFYRRAYGLRHDDDWLKQNVDWSWVDTRYRGEDILLLDTTGKFMVEFLPGEHWVGEIKTRFSDNFFNQEQNLMVRPGLTYFWVKDGRPFMNFFAQIEMDFALNYADCELNERWLYVGSLYRVTANLDVGGFVANKWQAWHSSSAYLEKNGTPYTATATTQVFTALLIMHI